MSDEWVKLSCELLEKFASYSFNGVRAVNRCIFDMTNEPPGTIEWEQCSAHQTSDWPGELMSGMSCLFFDWTGPSNCQRLVPMFRGESKNSRILMWQ